MFTTVANISDQADEVVGLAKQAAGDLTGDHELRAEGTTEKSTAQVSEGVDDAVEKASKQVSDFADKATDTAEQLPTTSASSSWPPSRGSRRPCSWAA